ncbi:uncharacterized protein LOC131036824 [Cryptomeria japonica]|uniref:uncharacterized protein LOC131036824 n=1 Tax=Cryptomeria japonica TaxID=3369 RepID=UPI0027DA5C0E|nr:uncharacterized protein LOC131036824 [Cryptomeria japonica]
MYSWSFHPNDWFKANFDGAVEGNPGFAGYSGVIQNGATFCIRVVAFPLGNQTNHLAEAMGALQAIKLAHNLGFKFLSLEGDSKNIINCLFGKHQPLWTIKNIINSNKEMLEGFDQCYTSHDYREAKRSANCATNETV